MSEPLSPQYDPHAIERPLYREWEESGLFHAHAEAVRNGTADPYVIVIPPPNVTAVLHMGHGLNNTIQDVLVRWQRMRGREALYLPGTDHAGIATQNVVERLLASEGKRREELGRDAFVQRVWEFVDATGSTILQQLRAIGCSCDWTRTRFTLEPDLSRAVREAFVRLYEKGLIYRGNYIINWCPRCLTALSDEEAEAEDSPGKLYYLRYPIVGAAPAGLPTLPDGRAYLVVATTRPETMLGDTAVAVHPEDSRYRALVGREVLLPLVERVVPVVADAFVDATFGTGAVKITPAHDPNDFELALRHDLAPLNVLTPDARLNEHVPAAYRGLDRFEGRRRVLADFDSIGLLERIEEHTHGVPHCYRCHTVVEPRLSDQWFVRMRPLAEPALAAARSGRVRFTPERHARIYEHWLENIRDWCISRQLWWGHRIPVFYCLNSDCREQIVARTDPTACPACGGTELEQDQDVLDTWFSSWLWPFSTLGWPEQSEDLAAFYPTHTLVTAPEILFFWVARMIMAGLEFMGEVPFRDVYLTGTVRDLQNRKMSKSLGNGIDPLEVVNLFGADALRFTVMSNVGMGTDVRMDPADLETTFAVGRNFANKLWNAGRFALLNLAVPEVPDARLLPSLELADRWILSRLRAASAEVDRSLAAFRFKEAAEAAYQFFWGELADWYLEVIKPRLQADGAADSAAAAQATLVLCLDGIFRLLHPLMPFITDALWRRLPMIAGQPRSGSIMAAAWPVPDTYPDSTEAEDRFGALAELIGAVRGLRSEYGVPPTSLVRIRLGNVSPELSAALAVEERAVLRLARVQEIELGSGNGGAGAHAVLRGGVELFIPLAGVIDLEQERMRLEKELERLDGQLRATETKLHNEQFTSRAPVDVVERERAKAENFRDQRDRLAAKISGLRPNA
ncbi:MAG: valine--tRNA ligase [Gemmatimonadetes bacterium]|nr:valine--tRNA ligase [Gemmatimonadota bacterium]